LSLLPVAGNGIIPIKSRPALSPFFFAFLRGGALQNSDTDFCCSSFWLVLFLYDMPSISKQFVRLKLSLFGVLHKL